MWYFLRVAFNTYINCSFVQLYLPILLLPFLYFIPSRSRPLRVNFRSQGTMEPVSILQGSICEICPTGVERRRCEYRGAVGSLIRSPNGRRSEEELRPSQNFF